MKRCSTSLIIREMQIKTTMRYHRIPVRMVITRKSTRIKAGEGVAKRKPFYTVVISHFSHARLFVTLWIRTTGFSVHGILQARILEWVATPFSRESSWPRMKIGAATKENSTEIPQKTKNVITISSSNPSLGVQT